METSVSPVKLKRLCCLLGVRLGNLPQWFLWGNKEDGFVLASLICFWATELFLQNWAVRFKFSSKGCSWNSIQVSGPSFINQDGLGFVTITTITTNHPQCLEQESFVSVVVCFLTFCKLAERSGNYSRETDGGGCGAGEPVPAPGGQHPCHPPRPPPQHRRCRFGAYNCLERLKQKNKAPNNDPVRGVHPQAGWSPGGGPATAGEWPGTGIQAGGPSPPAVTRFRGPVRGWGCLQTPSLEGETGGTGFQALGESGAKPELRPDLKPFKYLGIWYIPFKYLNLSPEYFITPFKYLAVWAPFAVSASGPATLRAGLWGIIIIIITTIPVSCMGQRKLKYAAQGQDGQRRVEGGRQPRPSASAAQAHNPYQNRQPEGNS